MGRGGASRRRPETQTEIDRHERWLGRKETWSLDLSVSRRCSYCGRTVPSWQKGPPVCPRPSCVGERTSDG